MVHLVPHRLQLTRERFLNFRTLQNHCIYLDTKSTTHILELTGEPLVLLCELGDQQTLLLLRRPLRRLSLVEQGTQALHVKNLHAVKDMLSHHCDFAASCNIS